MAQTMLNAPTLALALAGGVALFATIETFVPAGHARLAPRNGAGQSVTSLAGVTPNSLIVTHMEVDNGTQSLRFYANGKQLAILDTLGLHIEDAAGQ